MVPIRVHGGLGPRTVKEKVDLDLKPSQGLFLGFTPETVKEKVEPDPKP